MMALEDSTGLLEEFLRTTEDSTLKLTSLVTTLSSRLTLFLETSLLLLLSTTMISGSASRDAGDLLDLSDLLSAQD